MEQKKASGFGFRGWMLIIYQAIAYITFQCFTQYPLNILADFYGGSQKVANIYSICAVVGILVQIVLAGIVAKMKRIKLFGAILGAVTLVLAFLVMTLPAGTGWDISYALINVLSVLYATFALGILVGQWFPTRKGVVMGIATLAFPIANGLLGPFASAVFAKGFPDIKGAFLPFFIVSVVGWVIGLIFIRDYPEECGAFRDNDRNMTPEVAKAIMEQEIENKKTSVWTYLHTIKCKEFWFGTINVALLLSCSIGLMSQSNAIITHYPELNYTTVMMLVMIFGMIGSFVLGLLDQKLGTKKAMIISACLMIIGGVLGLFDNATALLLAMIFVAMFMGASSNFGVSHAAQYWRREDFSRIFTLSSPIGSMISSASPALIAALLFGATGYKGHSGAFTFVAISGVVALVVMLIHKPSHIKEMDDKYRAAAGKPLDDALVGRK
ncbi:MAG: MFS transporter [Clostridia bacterium]|nr:MFS transporter [Clostridia bacterium]